MAAAPASAYGSSAANAMTALATCREAERAAEVRLAQLLFGGGPYRSDEHMAACAALEAARNATTAAERNAAGAAFGSLLTKVKVPAKPRRSRRIAATAEARATKAAAAAAAASEIDAYLVEEEVALSSAARAAQAEAKERRKLETKLSLVRLKHDYTSKRYVELRTAAEESSKAFFDLHSKENLKEAKMLMNAVRAATRKFTISYNKIKALEALLAAL